MPAFLWSLFAHAGWIALVAASIPALRRQRVLTGVIVLTAAWPVAWLLRGMFAEASCATAAVVWAAALPRFRDPTAPAPRVLSTVPALGIIGLAAVLYASAIGTLPVDLYYAPGHERRWLVPLAFAPVAWISFRAGDTYGKAFPVAALLAVSGLHESHNAWDAFIDPALPLLAMVEIVRNRRHRPAGTPDKPVADTAGVCTPQCDGA